MSILYSILIKYWTFKIVRIEYCIKPRHIKKCIKPYFIYCQLAILAYVLIGFCSFVLYMLQFIYQVWFTIQLFFNKTNELKKKKFVSKNEKHLSERKCDCKCNLITIDIYLLYNACPSQLLLHLNRYVKYVLMVEKILAIG